MGLFNILSLVFLVSEIVLLMAKKSRSGQTSVKKDRHSMLVLWIVITASVAGAFALSGLFPRTGKWITLAYAGAGIMVLGMAVRWTAIVQLGKAFTVDVAITTNHRLMDSGLYSVVRHPSYLGLLLTFLGMSLFFNSWVPLFSMNIPIFLALHYRMNVEEELLVSHFGEAYTKYMQRVKRLVVGVY